MTNNEIANAIRSGLFADRENLKEAFDYAFSVFRSLGQNETVAITALMVVTNTIAKELLPKDE
jgi:hypothetical protein